MTDEISWTPSRRQVLRMGAAAGALAATSGLLGRRPGRRRPRPRGASR